MAKKPTTTRNGKSDTERTGATISVKINAVMHTDSTLVLTLKNRENASLADQHTVINATQDKKIDRGEYTRRPKKLKTSANRISIVSSYKTNRYMVILSK